ncbi:MAG: translocation and assembly module lipoprotein TamL, partial [Bacteroidia bacterium]
MGIKHNTIQLLFIALLPLVFFACNPTRKLAQGEYLLQKNHVIDKDTKLDKSEIESYIKQKPNRKILLVFRFHLWLHNLANEDRIKRKRIAYNKKIESRNNKRVAKGKQPKKSDRQLFGEWLLSVGEAPVIYDTLLAEKSAKQIKLFLYNKGYFINSVKDSVAYGKRKRASVYYKIKASAPYKINKVEYKIPDDLLKYYVVSDSSNCLIRPENNYDVDIMQQERERITTELNNNGYWLFTKDYVYYEIDSTIGNKRVNITLGIKNFAYKYSETSDSIAERPHQRFYINNIYIQPDFVSKKVDATLQKDTIKIETPQTNGPPLVDYYILHTSKLQYKTRVLLNSVFLHKGELYQLKNTQDTYKRISELKAFKTINIYFTAAANGYLDCHIELSPISKQAFSIETEGTNKSGSLGVSGSVVYQNKNLFHGAEIFELRLKGGIEAQRNVVGASDLNQGSQFNTIEFGPEANLYIPRFLVPFHIKQSINSNPKTTFTSSLNYQSRSAYTRYISNLSFAYTWKETAEKQHSISPIVLNFVKVKLSPDFAYNLENNVHDLYLKNSFSNHMSTSTRYTYLYNEQNIKKEGNFRFFKLNLESSGNLLRGFYDLANTIHPNTILKDPDGHYKLFDVVYSQYLRIDGDFRYYYNSSEINKVVFRFAAGIGKPLVNFPSLPFERSFYSGGANGIRA